MRIFSSAGAAGLGGGSQPCQQPLVAPAAGGLFWGASLGA